MTWSGGSLAPRLLRAMGEKAWLEAERIIAAEAKKHEYAQYRDDPVGFGERVLGERFIPGIRRVMESVRDYPITIAKSATGVGKSHGAARTAIWWFRTFPDSKIYLTAAPPIENLKRILWGEVNGVVERQPDLFVADRVQVESITRHAESFMTCVAIPTSGSESNRESKFSGKHAPHLLFIVDEGDAVPDEVYRGIEGCMSGGMARLLIMFNPKVTLGKVFEMEATSMANVVSLSAFEHPNVITGKDLIPGAVSQEVTVRRINDWTRPLYSDEHPDQECFTVPDFLVGKQAMAQNGRIYPPLLDGIRKVTELQFWYMVMGTYPPIGETQLINREWLDKAIARWKRYREEFGGPPPILPITGIDISELGGDWNSGCNRYGNYVDTFTQWQGMDVIVNADRALKLVYDRNPSICFIDAMGVGSAVAPYMARKARAEGQEIRVVGIKVSEKPSPLIKSELGEFFSIRDQLWWAVREWLRTEEAMLPPDQQLVEELAAPSYKVMENGRIKVTAKDEFRKTLKRSPDRADALCLTFYPMRKPQVLMLQT